MHHHALVDCLGGHLLLGANVQRGLLLHLALEMFVKNTRLCLLVIVWGTAAAFTTYVYVNLSLALS